MKEIYSIQDVNFTDFDGRPAITLFFAGCNMRCSFCQNNEIVNGVGKETNDLGNIKMYVDKMRMTLPNLGVVFSGGEPTCSNYFHKALMMFHDFPLAIHTNGLIKPSRIKNPFEAVVLSIKPLSEIGSIFKREQYLTLMAQAIKYYDNSKYKEVRFVETSDADFAQTIDMLYDLRDMLRCPIDKWKLKSVPDATLKRSQMETNYFLTQTKEAC